MTTQKDGKDALRAVLAAQNTPRARARGWVRRTLIPSLADNAAHAEGAVLEVAGRPFAGARCAIRTRPFAWILSAASMGFVVGAWPLGDRNKVRGRNEPAT